MRPGAEPRVVPGGHTMLAVVALGLTLAFTTAPIAESAQWARRERCFIATDGTTHFKGACKVGDRKNGETHVVTINRKPQLSPSSGVARFRFGMAQRATTTSIG